MLTLSEIGRSSGLARKKPHAVVIGSGIGGLAAAIRLGARGYRVSIFERLDAPGGRAYVFRKDGFTFDGGPTIITAPFLFEELWRLCGRSFEDDIELRELAPFYTIRFDDGDFFRVSGDPEEMRREVQRISAEDVEGYERFMAHTDLLYQIGFEQCGDKPFSSVLDMVKIAPDLIRLRSYKSLHKLVGQYVVNPKLRFVLSFHPLFVGGNPFRVTSIYGLISSLERRWGVHHAMGGTGKLIDGMANLIEDQGSSLFLNCDVAEILVDNNRATGIRLATGEQVRADVVVSNADSAWTYRHLLPRHARRHWTNARIESAQYSMSLFVWYFGTNRQFTDIPHHTILCGPRYKDLLTDIFERKVLADDFSLYLHRPTATDPSLAPPGCDTFYVLSPVPHLDSQIDWNRQAECYRKRIEEKLSQTLLPDFAKSVVTSRVLTPNDFRDRLLSMKGAAFGMEPLLTQSAWFRPHNKSEDVENLFLVGAGTHPGAGVPGVLSSARILDKVVPDAAAFTS